jgi:hypothetical protein
MSDPLQGDQHPTCLTEENVREIAREEAGNALVALKEELYKTLERAEMKMRPEVAM